MKFASGPRSLLFSHAISFWHGRGVLINELHFDEGSNERERIDNEVKLLLQVGSSTFGFTSIHPKCQLGSESLTNHSRVINSLSKWKVFMLKVKY